MFLDEASTRQTAATGSRRAWVWLQAWRGDRLVLLAIVAAYLLATLLLLGHVTTRLDPVTGDEPFYLVTAGSILRDGDIDESNNWAERDVDAWLPPDPLPAGWEGWPAPARGFPPHASATVRPGLYSKHGLGVPVLILAPLAVGGRTGVVLLYCAIGALIAGNIYLLARHVGASIAAAIAITAALALTNPLLSYSFLIFPELPAALLTIYVFRRALAETSVLWQSALMGLAVGYLPWLHARLALVALALALMVLVRALRRQTRLVLPAFLGPPVLSALAVGGFYWYFYGRPWPNMHDHAGMAGSISAWAMGLAGLVLDQQWGLLIHAPAYLLVVAGAAALLRRQPALLGWSMLVAVPYYAFVAAYNQWWGEWCPPARYLVVLAPLAAAPLGALLAGQQRMVSALLLAVLSAPGALVIAKFLEDPQRMYHHPDGQSNLLRLVEASGWPGLSQFVPSFVAPAATSDAVRWVWVLAMLAAVLVTLALTDEDGPVRRPAQLSEPPS